MKASLLLSTPPPPVLPSKLPAAALAGTPSLHLIPSLTFPSLKHKPGLFPAPRPDFSIRADDGDADGGGPDHYDMDEEEAEEVDNKKDYDVEYEPLAAGIGASVSVVGGDDDIAMVHSKSFVSTQGWDSETVVDYRINEDEFHKISLLDCDFFIRKPPDPDNDVYDFREMYVTPPDTDIYSIPKVFAPMPQKYIRCAKSDYGCYNVTEPPIDAPRDPLYKSEKEITKVFLTKHYRNRRLDDPEFVLDFEEIYVIDSKTKLITRAKILVLIVFIKKLTYQWGPRKCSHMAVKIPKGKSVAIATEEVPEGRNRDRKKDLLVIRDNGTSFKIIPASEKDDPTTVIEREEWEKSRQDMERHLQKLRDFSVSNWF